MWVADSPQEPRVVNLVPAKADAATLYFPARMKSVSRRCAALVGAGDIWLNCKSIVGEFTIDRRFDIAWLGGKAASAVSRLINSREMECIALIVSLRYDGKRY